MCTLPITEYGPDNLDAGRACAGLGGSRRLHASYGKVLLADNVYGSRCPPLDDGHSDIYDKDTAVAALACNRSQRLWCFGHHY